MQLPVNANIPPNNIGAYTILIAGQKKAGKTSFGAAFPNPFVMQFEPGNSKALPVKQIDITDWRTTLDVIDLLEKNPLYADTIIIDDIPSMYMYARNYICNRMKIDYPDALAQGKGWNMVNVEFNTVINRIQALPSEKIYTAHSEVKQADTRTGRSVATLETKMGRGADTIMDAKCQIVGFIMYNDKKQRILVIEGDDYIVKAGQGLPNHFLDEEGTRLKEIPLGNSPKEGYENFVAAFNNLKKQPTNAQAQLPEGNKSKFSIKK